MRKGLCVVVLTALICVPLGCLQAEDISRQEMRSLDEQVQEIKSDVLSIAAELDQLEETLLYPSTTQVAVFVELAEGEDLRLDAVQIEIDGDLVAHYIYSFKELEALQGGGVQRIYTGNLPTGDHEIGISIVGKLPSGKDYSSAEKFGFTKGIEPKLLGVTLAASRLGNSGIRLGDW